MTVCKFVTEYKDEPQKGFIDTLEFRCQKSALSTGFCIFHDELYSNEHPEEIINHLMEEITSKISKSEPIYFIGYHIPSIIISRDFPVPIYFSKSKFHGFSSFVNSVFNNVVYFEEVDFNDVDFTSTQFDHVYFYNSHFKKATFAGTVFKYPIFTGSTFNTVLFLKCKIKHAFFAGINCKDGEFIANSFGYVSFHKSIFDRITFLNSLFDEATFTNVVFNKETNFEGAVFTVADFSESTFNKKANFSKVLFNNQPRIIFSGNLSNVSFMDSDVSRVRFSSKVKWGGENGFMIIDDVEARNEPRKANLHGILAIYRQLRENYEYNLRYDEAGQFFIKEMDLRREYEE